MNLCAYDLSSDSEDCCDDLPQQTGIDPNKQENVSVASVNQPFTATGTGTATATATGTGSGTGCQRSNTSNSDPTADQQTVNHCTTKNTACKHISDSPHKSNRSTAPNSSEAFLHRHCKNEKSDILDPDMIGHGNKNMGAVETNRQNYFGLMEEDSDEELSHIDHHRELTLSVHKTANTQQNKGSSELIPNSAFWKGDDSGVNWNDSVKTWGISPGTQQQNVTDCSNDVSSKPSHSNKTLFDPPTVNRKLEKSCFYTHHHIGPELSKSDGLRNCYPTVCSSEFAGHSGAVNKIVWCNNNFSHLCMSASMDQTVKVWNVFSKDKSCVQTMRHHDRAVKDCLWSYDGHQALSCGFDKITCLVDVEKNSCVQKFYADSFVTCLAYHPVNFHLFICGSNNKITAWDSRQSSRPIRVFKYKDNIGQVQDVKFLSDGKEFLSCNDLVARDSADRNIIAWNFCSSAAVSNQIYQERFTCTRLKLHPNKSLFYAQSQGDYIAEFSSNRPYKMNKYKRYQNHKILGYGIGFDISPDGRYIISGSSDGQIPIYDSYSSKVAHHLELHKNEVGLDVAWHPVLCSTVALATWSGSIFVWK